MLLSAFLLLLAVPAIAVFPAAVDVCDLSIVSAAANPTVANDLLPLLLLASLLNVAGFSTAAAFISDVNGVHIVVGLHACFAGFTTFASIPAVVGVPTVLAVLLLWQSCYCCHHRVRRVLSFFPSRLNWDFPTPSPAGECAPLWMGGGGGEGHTRSREKGLGSPNTDKGTALWHYVYVCSLCLSSLMWLVATTACVTAIACLPGVAGIVALAGVRLVPDVLTFAGSPHYCWGPRCCWRLCSCCTIPIVIESERISMS
jgi:hypothetical protein